MPGDCGKMKQIKVTIQRSIRDLEAELPVAPRRHQARGSRAHHRPHPRKRGKQGQHEQDGHPDQGGDGGEDQLHIEPRQFAREIKGDRLLY